jgi:mannosyl-oligosaccharide alpha-1,2-mannosidase
MPGFRRWGMSKFERNPESSFKLLAAVLVITLYLIIKEFQHPTTHIPFTAPLGAKIQYTQWNKTGKAQETRADTVREAMRYTFRKYRDNAWGYDDILPVSGGHSTSRNGWGAFIVDSASTLALMGLWEELSHSIEHILGIDFEAAEGLVDPFETTTRYLGGLLSIVELYDAGLIPQDVLHEEARDLILEHAVTLAQKLAPAYDTPTGMPWPRVDFDTDQGEPNPTFVFTDDPNKREYDHPVIGPARTGTSILENRVLTRMTGDPIYTENSTLAWAPLVWTKWISSLPGMVDAPIDIMTGAPVARSRHWDAGHSSYYSYLFKITLLSPTSDPHIDLYKTRFLSAASSLRKHLSSRSAPAPSHAMQHLFLGQQSDTQFLATQSAHACSASSTLLLASKYYAQPGLRTFALALLEGCRHVHTSSPTHIGPDQWAWTPKFSYEEPVLSPETERQKREWADAGFWTTQPASSLRPEYLESLFTAWRVTGEQRYRDWAWEAFEALEKHCKAPFGYAGLKDVYEPGGEANWVDEQEGGRVAQTLKYAWLTFADVHVASLDGWVFGEGGMFRMIR